MKTVGLVESPPRFLFMHQRRSDSSFQYSSEEPQPSLRRIGGKTEAPKSAPETDTGWGVFRAPHPSSRLGLPQAALAKPRETKGFLESGQRSGREISGNADKMAESLVDSELVSRVNSLIHRENAGKSRESADPGTARWSIFGSIPGPWR